jgi:cytochrome P450
MEAAELDLPHLPMDDPAFCADPLPHFEAARARHPWLAKSPDGFVITDYFAIRELMRDESKFAMPHHSIVDAMGARGTPWGDFIVTSIQGQTDDAHKRLRDIVAPAFTPRAANRQRELMARVVDRLLDEWAPRGAGTLRFDFEEFSSNFPITVFCEMIGASPDVVPGIRSSMEAIGQGFSMNRELLPKLQDAIGVMWRFAEHLVANRRSGQRRNADPDLLDDLIGAVDSGQMRDEELYNLLIFLFVAGYDTSKNVLTLIMYRMVDEPEIYARCAEDKDYCRKVVEEAFRYLNPVTSARAVTQDFTYRDVHFEAGSFLFLPFSMATRDPRAVENPEAFDPDRKQTNTHLSFGLGPRICLGRYIALAQLEEGLHQIARRILRPRLAGPIGWRPFPGTWGIRGLPIEAEAAGKEAVAAE